jgi:hypothetical protein
LSIIEIEIDKGRSTVHEILIEIDKLPRSDVAPRKTSHLYMNIHDPRPRAAAIYVDFQSGFHAQWNMVHRNGRARSFVDFNLDFLHAKINQDFLQRNEQCSFRCKILESISISIRISCTVEQMPLK